MAERTTESGVLIEIGKLFESKRKALGRQYKSREKFIEKRSIELFNSEDWISLRYLYNIEHGKNWISIEKLLLLSKALEIDPVDLFTEITAICLSGNAKIESQASRASEYRFRYSDAACWGSPKPRTGRKASSRTHLSVCLHASYDQQGESDAAVRKECVHLRDGAWDGDSSCMRLTD